MLGRNILASESDAKKQSVDLRIYDVLQGKDLWKQSFPANSIVLQSEDPRLAGVIEPGGQVRVIDVQTQKEVLNTPLADPKHAAGAQSVTLVSDPDYLYLAINGPIDPNLVPWGGGIQSNLMANAGLRSVPVNGMVYSFDRKTGKLKYHNPVQNQHMVLSMFDELPVLIFTSRYQQWVGNPPARSAMQVCRGLAFEKHTGKRCWENDHVPINMYFHGLSMDHRTGKVELTGANLKVTMTTVPR
jgi:hypothetical protein